MKRRTVLGALVVLAAVPTSGCRTRSPAPPAATDAELVRLTRTAAHAYRQVSPARAAPLYQAALARAEALGDASTVARLTYNLAVCLAESGQTAEALQLVREARLRFGVISGGHREDPLPELSLLEAVLTLESGEPGAESAARAARDRARAAGRRDLQAQASVMLAEIALRDGRKELARQELRLAQRHAGRRPPPDLAARIAGAVAAVAATEGHFAEAAAAWRRAAQLWGEAGRIRYVPEALERAGDAELRLGRHAEAAADFLRAARARLGAGDIAGTQHLLPRLQQLADELSDPLLSAAVETLVEETAMRRRERATTPSKGAP